MPPGFALFYTTADIDGRLRDGVEETLMAIVRERFGVEATLATCNQVHGAHVVCADPRQTTGDEPTCDALWTDRKGTALGIKVADCLPVTLIDSRNGVIANIHSGWRGAVQNITAATLDAAPLDPGSTIAFLGPTIRACCFEVGEEVAAQFDARFVDRGRGPKPHVDIAKFTEDVLRKRGVSRVVDTELCTRCDRHLMSAAQRPGFHSYRRDKQGGRNLAIVAR